MPVIDVILRLTVLVAIITIGMAVINLQHRVSDLEDAGGGDTDGQA